MELNDKQIKTPAGNERLGASGAVTRLKVCANLEIFRPSERQWKPLPCKVAGTLEAIQKHVNKGKNI
jgi:hypothetical protein